MRYGREILMKKTAARAANSAGTSAGTSAAGWAANSAANSAGTSAAGWAANSAANSAAGSAANSAAGSIARAAGSPARTASRVAGSAAGIAVAMAILFPTGVRAQRHGGHIHGEPEYEEPVQLVPVHKTPRVTMGGGLGMFVPQGEFGRFVGNGFGANFHVFTALESSNTFGLRFDGGYVNYGSSSAGYGGCCYGPAGPYARTSNNIGTFGVGPQLQVPVGPVRPYVNGYVGTGYFFTTSSWNDGYYYYGSSLYFDDWAFGYGGGGGLGIAFAPTILLNFDVQYRRHDDVAYLTEAGIYDDGFGGMVVQPIFSNADYWTFEMGVSFGF